MKIKKKSVSKIFIFVALCIFAFLFFFPYLYVSLSAFKPTAETISIQPHLLPSKLSFENFQAMLKRISVSKYYFNTFVAAFGGVIISCGLGTMSAYAISRSDVNKSKISTYFLLIVLCLKMIPISSIAVPIYRIITMLGLYDTRIALVLVFGAVNMPFVIWIMVGFFDGIPVSINEAACVDGASPLQTFGQIILPLGVPGIATVSIFTFFSSWNNFLLPLLLTSTYAKTFPVVISDFVTSYAMDMGAMCAAAFVFSFPVFIFSLFAQKYIIKGFVAGAVKE